ncbi:GNAT family N-acetyltransferase [Winogradskyella aurantia]|uniref:GNAT family N-acetyltransferase n=1 Tax=Winogradskyella aurantia TaxID=1915063 RepID=UPI0013FD3420|nr:GNAT family N-acetyltransferase [Winogradskyella aurantia]
MLKFNPFLSITYKEVWSKHFDKSDSAKPFQFMSGLEFLPHTFLPLYVSIGKTFTKGMAYALYENALDFRKKTFLIYDVPTYFEIHDRPMQASLGVYKSKQYPGFLIEVSEFKNIDAYLLSTFSKSSRNKLRKYNRRLEAAFKIEYKMVIGDISRAEYDFIFEKFKHLLEKRFQEKQITNNNLNEREWNFYYDVSYEMILERKASLFVIYDDKRPIGVTLCYLSNDTLFDAITVFDIDYSKFHLGSVTILKLIEWCMEEKMKILDFSKGYFDYKTHWCTKSYDFEYHIYFDRSSLRSRVIAYALKLFFDIKQVLREMNINEKFHKLTFKLRSNEKNKKSKPKFHFIPLSENVNHSDNDNCIDFSLAANENIKLMVFDYVYLNEERLENIKVFPKDATSGEYLILSSNGGAEAHMTF